MAAGGAKETGKTIGEGTIAGRGAGDIGWSIGGTGRGAGDIGRGAGDIGRGAGDIG